MKLSAKIGPSILNADLSNLASESENLLLNGADYLHLDVMDGNFVPNLTFGHPVVKCLRKRIKDAFFEVHMMVSEPLKWVNDMSDAGANLYTFHVEPVMENISQICRKIRESGMQVGLAVKPGTPIEDIENYIDQADVILVMTVKPGFGGQAFMENMMQKVLWLREQHPYLNISVDGGVGPGTIECCAKAGANMIVSGTAIIQATNQREVMNMLRTTVEKYFK